MTRKDFQLIADVLYQTRAYMINDSFKSVVHDFTVALMRTNVRFDANRFMHAAGWCSSENEPALPDEKGKCSLCHEYKV